MVGSCRQLTYRYVLPIESNFNANLNLACLHLIKIDVTYVISNLYSKFIPKCQHCLLCILRKTNIDLNS